MSEEPSATERQRVGLCLGCVHMRRVETPRGSVFYQCALAATDAGFPKYPRLPVVRCSGYEQRPEGSAREDGI